MLLAGTALGSICESCEPVFDAAPRLALGSPSPRCQRAKTASVSTCRAAPAAHSEAGPAETMANPCLAARSSRQFILSVARTCAISRWAVEGGFLTGRCYAQVVVRQGACQWILTRTTLLVEAADTVKDAANVLLSQQSSKRLVRNAPKMIWATSCSVCTAW